MDLTSSIRCRPGSEPCAALSNEAACAVALGLASIAQFASIQENSNAERPAAQQPRTQEAQATEEAGRSGSALHPDAGQDDGLRSGQEGLTENPDDARPVAAVAGAVLRWIPPPVYGSAQKAARIGVKK
jgi:hypothetical protein